MVGEVGENVTDDDGILAWAYESVSMRGTTT